MFPYVCVCVCVCVAQEEKKYKFLGTYSAQSPYMPDMNADLFAFTVLFRRISQQFFEYHRHRFSGKFALMSCTRVVACAYLVWPCLITETAIRFVHQAKTFEHLGTRIRMQVVDVCAPTLLFYFSNSNACVLQVWDTAGQERFRTITHTYFRGASGIFLV